MYCYGAYTLNKSTGKFSVRGAGEFNIPISYPHVDGYSCAYWGMHNSNGNWGAGKSTLEKDIFDGMFLIKSITASGTNAKASGELIYAEKVNNYSAGSYIGIVKSANSEEYPSNNRFSDGYWYIYKGIE